MEPIDAAYEKLLLLVDKEIPSYWESITTEADVRMKVIDRVFVEILGWPHSEIFMESPAGTGFIDYKCTVAGLSRLVIEAKKDSRDLGIEPDRACRFYKLNGPVFDSKHAQEGIDQAIRYCGYKNAELACVTNGRQWIVFRGSRLGDGKDTRGGWVVSSRTLATSRSISRSSSTFFITRLSPNISSVRSSSRKKGSRFGQAHLGGPFGSRNYASFLRLISFQMT